MDLSLLSHPGSLGSLAQWQGQRAGEAEEEAVPPPLPVPVRSWRCWQDHGFGVSFLGWCLHCSEHMWCPPKCSFTSWKSLEWDLTPEKAQRDGRHRPPRAAELSNPTDVGEPQHRNSHSRGSCPAQKPPSEAVALLRSQLSTRGAPAALQGGFGWALCHCWVCGNQEKGGES